ncbi:decapping endonuclease targeting mRNA [Rhodotorula kratochvilovae]
MAEPPRKRPRVSPPPTSSSSAPPPAPAAPSSSLPARPSAPATPPNPPCASHPVHPPAHYLSTASASTAFQQPFHLTSFSYSPTRELLLDDERKDDALAYYHEPRLGSDLNFGFERAVWRDGTVDEGLDALLDSLSTWAAKQPTPAADDLLGKISVITWRGMMTKLMLAVYEVDNAASARRGDGWEMNAMIVDGCLYLEESNPPSKLAAKSASESSNALPSYYGYSFESYCTAPSPSPADFPIPNTNVQWCSVVKTNLGGFRTIVGGEVDCVRNGADPRKITTGDFVELKTNIAIQSQRDEVNFERQKLLKHYVQSFLLGVPTVTVGFRTRQGHLTGLQSFSTLEIPRLVRGKPHAWTPAACLASARELLAFLHGMLAAHASTSRAEAALRASDESGEEELPAWPVFRVSFTPQTGVSVRELTEGEVRAEVWGAR